VLGERRAGAEEVGENEDKVLGLLPYKEPVGLLFSQFSTVFTSPNYADRVTSNFFNSILTKNIEMNSSCF
jgi:hypothetical protein